MNKSFLRLFIRSVIKEKLEFQELGSDHLASHLSNIDVPPQDDDQGPVPPSDENDPYVTADPYAIDFRGGR